MKEKNFLFCCFYRHPNSNPDNLSAYLQEVLSNPAVSNKQIFLHRDFNLDLLSYDSHTGTGAFVNLHLSKQFLPYIMHPTRVSDNSSTIIDNIFAKVLDQETVSGNSPTQITDHFPLFLIVKHAGIAYKNLSNSYRDVSKLNIDRFQSDFLNLDLTYLNDDQLDINSKFNRFLSDLDKLVKTHAPLKKIHKERSEVKKETLESLVRYKK